MRPVWIAAVIGALGLAAYPDGASAQPDGLAIARAFREAHGARILADFASLLAVPNVASDSAGISRNAALIGERLRARGVSVEVLTVPGAAPLVFGELRVSGAARTLGLYAHYDGQPVGWCAVAPREAYSFLERSRVLKPVDEKPVWSVSCLFVLRPYRRRGLSARLLRAAVEFAGRRGAKIVEGYPVEPSMEKMPDAFAWTGLPASFRRAGFKEVARRSKTRPIMRRVVRER